MIVKRISNDELYHHGVKGQKWGVRRYQNPDGSLTAAGQAHYNKTKNKEIIKDRKQALKNRRLMSDDEIRQRIYRLKLEKELKQLTEEDITPAKAYTDQLLKSIGNKTIPTMVSGGILYGTKVGMTGDFNAKDAADYVTPKPGKKK